MSADDIRKSQTSSDNSILHPPVGTMVTTACGGKATYTPALPWAVYRGKVVYFCMAACKADFDQNPSCSCLAARLDEFD